MKFDVYLDSGVSVEVDENPDTDPVTGEPRTEEDNAAYAVFRAKAKAQLIAMLESDSFDLSYDETPS